MSTESDQVVYKQDRCRKGHYHSSVGDAVYGFGIIGAAIFFIGQATTFWVKVYEYSSLIRNPVFLVLAALQALM